MLEKLKPQDFDRVFMLLENSFPPDEYRTYEEHKALLDNDLYTIYALYDGIKLKAFISVWEFDKFAYEMCIRDRFSAPELSASISAILPVSAFAVIFASYVVPVV